MRPAAVPLPKALYLLPRYLHALETGSELRIGLMRWIVYCSADRSGVAGETPDEVYKATEMRSTGGKIETWD